MHKTLMLSALLASASCAVMAQMQTNNGVEYLQNNSKDMSTDFSDLSNTYFFADSLASFNTSTGVGSVNWKRYRLSPRQAFNLNGYWPVRMQMLDFPNTAYDNDPNLKIQIRFVSPRTVRITMLTTPVEQKEDDASDVMFVGTPKVGAQWKSADNGKSIVYTSEYGSLEIQKYPWRLILRDRNGKILTQTRAIIDNDSTQVKLLPFNFIKRGSDNSRSINPVFLLSPGEHIYGCGESFTKLDKVGQKVQLSVTDPQGPETDGQYKPVPFFFSNRGYGIFMHTSAPVTCDFGASYIGADRLFMGDEKMDFFVFFGEPKDILNEYTDITGQAVVIGDAVDHVIMDIADGIIVRIAPQRRQNRGYVLIHLLQPVQRFPIGDIELEFRPVTDGGHIELIGGNIVLQIIEIIAAAALMEIKGLLHHRVKISIIDGLVAAVIDDGKAGVPGIEILIERLGKGFGCGDLLSCLRRSLMDRQRQICRQRRDAKKTTQGDKGCKTFFQHR